MDVFNQLSAAQQSEIIEMMRNLTITNYGTSEITYEDTEMETDSDYGMETESESGFEANIDFEQNNYLKSNNMYGIITAPTQNGKTEYVIKLINDCMKQNIPVIVSSDDRKDQQNQLYSRIKNSLVGTDGMDIELLKVESTNFSKKIEECIENKKYFIIFVLGNAIQIKKLKKEIKNCNADDDNNVCKNFKKIKKIAMIHDEGDVVQKDSDVENVNSEQAKSHQEWIKLEKYIKNHCNLLLKRVFVTATPEPCMALHKIDRAQIYKIPTKYTYTGHDKIIKTNYKRDFYICDILVQNANRIRNNAAVNPQGEAILYCIERNTEKGDRSHIQVVNSLSQIPSLANCVIHTYNGQGYVVYTQNQELKRLLGSITVETVTKSGKTYYKEYNPIPGKYHNYITLDKNIPISRFYSLCKQAGELVVITIGKDLITRGISFVSECRENQLCATTMILKTGPHMHAVGANQIIGRITGNVRPDLERRLYASKKIISMYDNFNESQKDFLKFLEETDSIETTNILWKNFEFKRYIERVARPKLGLVMKCVQPPTEYQVIDGEIDRVNLEKLRKWLNDNENSIIARMVRFLYNTNVDITAEEFKNGIEYNGTYDQFINNIDHGRSIGSQDGFLWNSLLNNSKISLNPKIREYIDAL